MQKATNRCLFIVGIAFGETITLSDRNCSEILMRNAALGLQARRVLVLAPRARSGSILSRAGHSANQQQNRNQPDDMKKLIAPAALALSAVVLLNGCVAAIGNRGTERNGNTTLGQQLIDL